MMRSAINWALFALLIQTFPLFAGDEDAPKQDAPNPTVTIASFREGIVPVTLPDTSGVEDVVRNQILRFQSSLEHLIQSNPDSGQEIGNGFGFLGQVLLAYAQHLPAADCFRNAHLLDPDKFQWLYLLGYTLLEYGSTDEAETTLEEAARLKADYPALWIRLGELQMQNRTLDKSTASYGKALELDPNQGAVYYGLGQVALSRKDYPTAAMNFEKTLKLVPEASQVYYPLGMAYRRMEREDLAKVCMERAGKIGVRPKDPIVEDLQKLLRGERIHTVRGKQAFSAGHFPDAVRSFRSAVAANPESVGARVNLGSALGQVGQIDEAAEQFQTALQLDPENENATFNLGAIYARRGMLKEAEPLLRKSLASHPEDLTAQFLLADVLSKIGDREEALSLYTAVSEAQPDNEKALLRRSILLMESNEVDTVFQLLNENPLILEGTGELTHFFARFLLTCPKLELRDGNRAKGYALQLVQIRPTTENVETMAMALAAVGECSQAAEWQLRVVESLEPDGDYQALLDARKTLRKYNAGPPCN